MIVRKGDFVIYEPGGLPGERVTATVRTMHRDGTATIIAGHYLRNGKRVGAYLGYRYRVETSALEPAVRRVENAPNAAAART